MEKKYLEDTAAYLNADKKKRILFELYNNAYRTLKSVYLFKHFDEYARQLASDKQADKQDIYWTASYDEKLIDYVKISIAFETYNKAVLLENNIVIHKIKKNSGNSSLFNDQGKGIPIQLSDFLKVSMEEYDKRKNIYFLGGFRESFETINYSSTLSEQYQNIIQLDEELCNNLKEINEKRNRLHFFTEYKSAFSVTHHIAKWRTIKEKSILTLHEKMEQLTAKN